MAALVSYQQKLKEVLNQWKFHADGFQQAMDIMVKGVPNHDPFNSTCMECHNMTHVVETVVRSFRTQLEHLSDDSLMLLQEVPSTTPNLPFPLQLKSGFQSPVMAPSQVEQPARYHHLDSVEHPADLSPPRRFAPITALPVAPVMRPGTRYIPSSDEEDNEE